MNLQHVVQHAVQHAVQHLLNVSLAKLHTNKPTGTPGLISTSDIIPARTIRTKSQKNMFICICGRWERSHYICINLECLCSNILSLYEQ